MSVFFSYLHLWRGFLDWEKIRFSISFPKCHRKVKKGRNHCRPHASLLWEGLLPSSGNARFPSTARAVTSFPFTISMSPGQLVSPRSPNTREYPWLHLLTLKFSFLDLLRKSPRRLPHTTAVDWKGKDCAFPLCIPSAVKELLDSPCLHPLQGKPTPGSLTKPWGWQWHGAGTHSIPSWYNY